MDLKFEFKCACGWASHQWNHVCYSCQLIIIHNNRAITLYNILNTAFMGNPKMSCKENQRSKTESQPVSKMSMSTQDPGDQSTTLVKCRPSFLVHFFHFPAVFGK